MSLLTGRLPDNRKLRHVIGVARAGSFTGATKLLAISQSALTKSVAEVEAQLGYPLFERLPRGVRLTAAGELFVRKAERLLSELGALMADMDQIADLRQGRLRLGVAPSAFMTFVETSVPAFAQLYPGIEIDLQTGTVDEMAKALINRDIDLVVGASNYLRVWQEVETIAVGTLSTFVIGRKDHPAGPNPSAAELLQYPLVLPATGLSTEVNLAGAYLAAGLQPRSPHYVCDHFPIVLELVARTDAISPVVTLDQPDLGGPGRRMKAAYTIYSDIVELEGHELGFSVPSREAASPPATAFIDLFQATLSSQQQPLI
ncbi:MAG: LysR family transcriptional regulator [Pseudomonadota bacterium]